MRSAILLLLLARPLHAALLAHVATTKGIVTVELEHATAPQAVANFMTLAQGTRNRVHPLTGVVTNAPLYIGEKFFRTANNANFKFAQTGSGSGTNAGSSGFGFRDEFTPTVRHTGYTLSSANAGPNTNGGQIFFTGNVAIPTYNDVHSIIGLVPDPASRAVIDAIIAAGDNGSTITGITFVRTDAAALAFNELEEGLPEVSEIGGTIAVVPGTAVNWTPPTPLQPGNQYRAFRSPDLASWSGRSSVFIGNNDPPLASAAMDDGTLSRAFYRFSRIRYPDDQTRSSLASTTFLATLGTSVLNYAFDATGTAGTVTLTRPGQPDATGPFVMIEKSVDPYKLVMTMDNTTAFGPRYLRFTARSDKFMPGLSSGRLSVEYGVEIPNSIFWFPFASGTQTLSN